MHSEQPLFLHLLCTAAACLARSSVSTHIGALLSGTGTAGGTGMQTHVLALAVALDAGTGMANAALALRLRALLSLLPSFFTGTAGLARLSSWTVD